MELLEPNANPVKVYRQAKRILKGTSRAKNPDWYRRASDLQLQWHLWVGTKQVVSALYSASLNQWFEGPGMPAVAFEVDENGVPTGLDSDSRNQLHELLRQIFASKQFGGKPKSLGIVFHLADAIRVRDLAPDFAADSNFESVNELLSSEPGIALGDDSVHAGEGFWRLFPLIGNSESDKLSVAVQISSQYKFIIEELKNYGDLRNIPVIAEVISAALEGVASLPTVHPEGGKFENTISLVQFDAFTLVVATGKSGEMLMVRPLPHKSGNTLTPPETSELLNNTGALLNLRNPKIVVVSMSGVSAEELNDLLLPYAEANENAKITCINAQDHVAVENIPGNRFEFAFLTAPFDPKTAPNIPLSSAREKWAIQDFCGDSSYEISKMPTRGDLRILKFSLFSQKVAVVALLAFAGWTGADFISKMRSDAWKLAPGAAQEMQVRLSLLQKEKAEWQHWQNLLAKRSEGWVAMESILTLFPDNGGVILNSATYKARAGEAENKSDELGFGREWSLSGYANPKVATNLASLGSRSYVVNVLNNIAEQTEADYLAVDSATRNLKVTFQQKQGTMPPTANFPARVARHFRTAFELGIEQSFTSKDELAMRTTPLKVK